MKMLRVALKKELPLIFVMSDILIKHTFYRRFLGIGVSIDRLLIIAIKFFLAEIHISGDVKSCRLRIVECRIRIYLLHKSAIDRESHRSTLSVSHGVEVDVTFVTANPCASHKLSWWYRSCHPSPQSSRNVNEPCEPYPRSPHSAAWIIYGNMPSPI